MQILGAATAKSTIYLNVIVRFQERTKCYKRPRPALPQRRAAARDFAELAEI